MEGLLRAVLAGMPPGVAVVRNILPPSRIPLEGLLIVRDGVPGEPEVVLSPRQYFYEHRAEVDIVVDLPEVDRDARFDLLKEALGGALADDRTLGGVVDWCEPVAPSPLVLALEGANEIKAATVAVVLHYGSADPLA